MNKKFWLVCLLGLLIVSSCRPAPVPTTLPTIAPTGTLITFPTTTPSVIPTQEQLSTPTALPLPVAYPSISRYPSPWDWYQGVWSALPAYNPEDANNPWQMDLRSSDLSGLDLRGSLKDLMYASFDGKTRWPSADRLPPEYNLQKILAYGRNPGLGLGELHKQGVTGRGVGIAIIDQPLLVDHQEYKDRVRFYEETDDVRKSPMASMHGPAVASIAVGKTVGVAPEADLYFIASYMCSQGTYATVDFSCLAASVRRILAINQSLPEGQKIRVLSMSIGWDQTSLGYAEIQAAAEEAKKAGLLVICSSVSQVHGFKFMGLGRDPLADPNRFESYVPGIFEAKYFLDQGGMTNSLWVPMDSRAAASPGGSEEYAFYRSGGWSWSIPYIAGMYALAAQVKPAITPDEFWSLALKTGRTVQYAQGGKTVPLGPILDPAALVKALKQ